MRLSAQMLGLYVVVVSSSTISCQGAAPATEGATNAANAPPATPAALAPAPAPTPAPAPAAAAPPADSNAAKLPEEVCPFPRRCADACKKAHFAAMETCSADWATLIKAVPNTNEMGLCTARCLTSKNDSGCVGAATKEECACTHKCLEGVPAALRDKGAPYLRCYANAVSSACY